MRFERVHVVWQIWQFEAHVFPPRRIGLPTM
jgi:hypothetical protein